MAVETAVQVVAQLGAAIRIALAGCGLAVAAAAVAAVIGRPARFWADLPRVCRREVYLLTAMGVVYLLGFLLVAWLHWRIHEGISLELPQGLGRWLNQRLAAAGGGLPPYDPARPPRYAIPLWIENEKYLFWFMTATWMAVFAHRRLAYRPFQLGLLVMAAVQAAILCGFTDPFSHPLPRFFAEIGPWLAGDLAPGQRLQLFMQLYPRMVFYYNASYMWLHPPLLFLAYGCITITCLAGLCMLRRRDPVVEQVGYGHARTGFFLLTLGMLLGYPWAIQAWGANWWWDPKICASIMMWAVYATYLHTRLYLGRSPMWYASAGLAILCFGAMVFTFLASFYFPGQHTFQ